MALYLVAERELVAHCPDKNCWSKKYGNSHFISLVKVSLVHKLGPMWLNNIHRKRIFISSKIIALSNLRSFSKAWYSNINGRKRGANEKTAMANDNRELQKRGANQSSSRRSPKKEKTRSKFGHYSTSPTPKIDCPQARLTPPEKTSHKENRSSKRNDRAKTRIKTRTKVKSKFSKFERS